MTMRLSRRPRVALLLSAVVVAGCANTSAVTTTAPSPAVVAPAAGPTDPCPAGAPAARRSYSPGGSVAELSGGSSVQAIKRRGRLIVGTSGDVLLWGSRNPATGRLEGFDIDMAREVARAIFGSPDKIEYRVINYGQRLPALSGEVRAKQQAAPSTVDLVLHTMTINCERWTQIAFSSEYYSAGQKVLVRADLPALASKKAQNVQITDLEAQPGTRVCVAEGSTNLDNLKAYPQLDRNKVTVSDLGECLVKFQLGEADAITGDDTVLAGFAAQDPYARVVGPAFSDEPYGIGVAKDKTDLVRFVNAVLEQTRSDGTWASIYKRWMGSVQPGQPVPDPPQPLYGR